MITLNSSDPDTASLTKSGAFVSSLYSHNPAGKAILRSWTSYVSEPFRQTVTKNRCVTHVKIRGYANLVSSLLAYLISAVASWFSNSILSRSRMLLQIACYCNVTLFSIAGKF